MENPKIVEGLSYLITKRLLESSEAKNEKDKRNKEESAKALMRVRDNILNCGFEIRSVHQLDMIPGAGQKTRDYVKGILSNLMNGSNLRVGIPEIDKLNPEEFNKLVTLTEMIKIPDVGIKRAENYYLNGHTNIEEFKNFILNGGGTNRSIAALQNSDQGLRRIPREKITFFLSRFDQLLQFYNSSTGSSLIREIGGSYSRGKPNSGDIDILLWSFAPRETTNKVPNFLEFLRQNNCLLQTNVSGPVVYQGYAYIDPEFPSVRIDIKSLPDLTNYHYAMLHLTGPGSFNIRMSDIARSKGWTLGSNGMTVSATMEPIYVRSESDIFLLLGVPYLAPNERM